MLSDIEIWRAANQLIERYGDCAKFEVAQRADAMLERGDMEGLAVWKRILAAVNELQSTERPAGKNVH